MRRPSARSTPPNSGASDRNSPWAATWSMRRDPNADDHGVDGGPVAGQDVGGAAPRWRGPRPRRGGGRGPRRTAAARVPADPGPDTSGWRWAPRSRDRPTRGGSAPHGTAVSDADGTTTTVPSPSSAAPQPAGRARRGRPRTRRGPPLDLAMSRHGPGGNRQPEPVDGVAPTGPTAPSSRARTRRDVATSASSRPSTSTSDTRVASPRARRRAAASTGARGTPGAAVRGGGRGRGWPTPGPSPGAGPATEPCSAWASSAGLAQLDERARPARHRRARAGRRAASGPDACSLQPRTAAGRPPLAREADPEVGQRARAVGGTGPHLVAGEGPAVLVGDAQAAAHRPHGPAPVAGGVVAERLGVPRPQPRGGRAGRPVTPRSGRARRSTGPTGPPVRSARPARTRRPPAGRPRCATRRREARGAGRGRLGEDLGRGRVAGRGRRGRRRCGLGPRGRSWPASSGGPPGRSPSPRASSSRARGQQGLGQQELRSRGPRCRRRRRGGGRTAARAARTASGRSPASRRTSARSCSSAASTRSGDPTDGYELLGPGEELERVRGHRRPGPDVAEVVACAPAPTRRWPSSSAQRRSASVRSAVAAARSPR